MFRIPPPLVESRLASIAEGSCKADFGVTKIFPVSEAMLFQIRGEFFNIFNHAQFINPSGNISSGSFGNVTNARDPRIGQVSAKFIW
jgi:hypothetical protein